MIPNDSRDFYPTPSNLAWKMIHGLFPAPYGQAVYQDFPMLEPSAGSGALAQEIEKYCGIYRNKNGQLSEFGKDKRKRLDLDCIEISADFRAILKKDGFRVVHDDFLTFRPCKQYKAIIMNPPFSDGAAHLLKALEIMRDGGKIRCILNAETIRNPCTNERKALVQALNEYGAEIEYIADAFKNAARKTDVEIAFISVDIPDREPVSRIRLDLKRELADQMEQNPELAALVSSDPITAAIERYNAAAQGLARIYDEFSGIHSLFSTSTKDGNENSVVSLSFDYNSALRNLRGLYWQKLFDLPQIRNNLTQTMQYEYSKRIDELRDYDFSPYNIWTIREEISRNLVTGIENELIKLFDDWTRLHYNSEYSQNIHYFNGWCTNESYKIGKKVIFRCNAFSDWSGEFQPDFRTHDTIHNVEMLMHYLDTNGKQYDDKELRGILLQAKKDGQTRKIKCRYFDLTFYKKGTCHLEFTNADVLKSFNLFACQRKGWLPPCYGKKAYRDMTAADKKVVDSFEGEASYTDTVARHLIPTSATLLRLTQ